MKLLQDAPPGFEAIRKTFAMAQNLPSTHQLKLQIGLAQEGALFAVGRLDGHRQVSFFSEHLRALGWQEHLLGGDTDMQGCDMLFSGPAQPAHGNGEDPSFIRRPEVELWPVRGVHAGEP
jgi:hypothetical protein